MMRKIYALLVLACMLGAALATGDGTVVVGSTNVVTTPVATVDTAKTVTVGTTATNTGTSGIFASDNVVFLSSSAESLVPFKFF